MAKNIQLLKLTTGENLISEIVGFFEKEVFLSEEVVVAPKKAEKLSKKSKVVEAPSNTVNVTTKSIKKVVVRLKMPALIAIQPDKSGKAVATLVPFSPFTEDDGFDLWVETVQGIEKGAKQLVDQYIRVTTAEQSGIIIPPGGLITG